MSRTTPQVDEEDDGPRRGGRVRKNVERYNPPATGPAEDNEEGEEERDVDVEQESEMSELEDQPPRRPAKKRTSTGKTKKPAKPRKSKAVANGDIQPVEVADGFKDDCPLFNALLSPDIAIQQVIEDWVDTYQQTANDEVSEKASVHELVLFCIRGCGLGNTLDEDEAMDEDGMLDTIERIQDESVAKSAAAYPLIAKTKNLRSFRPNLNIFIPHLIKTLSLTPLLFETSETTSHSAAILPFLLNWLHSMSSSTLRPIRHTSTYLSLKIVSALCDVAASVSGDLSLRQRQRDAEAKKGGQGPAAQKRLKDLESKVKEARTKKQVLDASLQETFDVLFVNRVRDADPAIRTDCLRELGVWVKKYGEKFVSNSHLQYFTKGANDPDAHARLETVKALPSLFSNDQNLTRAQNIILRLAPRLIEMALRDVDLPVRVNAIALIIQVDKTGILADEHDDQRQRVARLVFDNEPKVRKAVGGFIWGLWQERVEALQTQWAGSKQSKKKRAANLSEEDTEERLKYRALAQLLVEISDSLDVDTEGASSSRQGGTAGTARMVARAKAAVEALWSDFEELQECQKLAKFLLLDHSQSGDTWLLEDDEESMMLLLLAECVKQVGSDDEDDECTKTLMNVLPKLLLKHQADSDRMAGILSMVEHMNVSLYLDMRKSSAYEGLWDDITKQFLQHTDVLVLSAAIRAINHLASSDAMDNTNSAKLLELEEALFTSLREAIDGEDVFSMTIEEDLLTTLQAILMRIGLLQRSRDIMIAMESEEGGQSSGWEIMLAFVERGEVGYKEEAKLSEYAIQVLFLHLTWHFRNFDALDGEDDEKVNALKERLIRAVKVFETLAIRGNASDVVRRQAFISFLNLHILFSTRVPEPLPAAKACAHTLPDEMQHRLGGAFGAAAERYASELEEHEQQNGDADPEVVAARKQQEFVFLQLVSVFVGGIRCGVLEMDHAREPLAHYGRFGPTYDAIVKKLVDVLRDEGIYNKQADTVQHVAKSALEASFKLFLDTDDEEPTATLSLGKLIASSFVVHGTHFSVLRQIHPDDVCDLHRAALDFLSHRLANYNKAIQSNGRKSMSNEHAQTKLNHCLTFFKVLLQLLGPISGRGAVSIRQKMDDIFKSSGVQPGNGKSWDGWRSYDKRLVNIASKDPNVKIAVTQKRVVEEDEEQEVATAADEAEEHEEDVEDFEPGGPISSTPQKRSRQAQSEDDDEGSLPPFGDIDVNLGLEQEDDIENDGELVETAKSKGKEGAREPNAKKRKTKK